MLVAKLDGLVLVDLMRVVVRKEYGKMLPGRPTSLTPFLGRKGAMSREL